MELLRHNCGAVPAEGNHQVLYEALTQFSAYRGEPIEERPRMTRKAFYKLVELGFPLRPSNCIVVDSVFDK
jgi:hypothetical protein